MSTSDLDGGGAERQFSHLAHHLPRERFDIHLSFWRSVFRYPCPPDLPVHRVPKTKPWHVVGAVLRTARLIDKVRPDVVFSQPHYVNMVTGTALGLCRHRPRWVCRQVNDPRREMKEGFFAAWARRALRRVDCVVGPSEGVRREMVRHLGVPAERTVRIDNVADVDAVQAAAALPLSTGAVGKRPGSFVIVHVGRFQPQKNQTLLLDAVARLRGDVELWMLGKGPLRARLEAHAEGLGIGSRVRWLGFQDNPYPFLAAADVSALSSTYEGLPNVVIESMLCGTPVVSTRCPYGPEELIDDDRTGLLVPMDDAEALGDALQRLVDDVGLASRLGRVAQETAEARFRTERLGQAYDELFTRLANGNGRDSMEGLP